MYATPTQVRRVHLQAHLASRHACLRHACPRNATPACVPGKVGLPRIKTGREVGQARHVCLVDLGDGEALVVAVLGVRGSVDPLEQGRDGRVDWEENARPGKAVRGLKRGIDAPVAGVCALPEADG
eukprot:scaffold6653_cov105-Phaeocystis_antarctica.AAC.3